MAVGVRISITEAVVAEGVDVWAEGEGVDVWAVGVMGVAEEKGSKDCPMDGNGDKTVFEEGLDVCVCVSFSLFAYVAVRGNSLLISSPFAISFWTSVTEQYLNIHCLFLTDGWVRGCRA